MAWARGQGQCSQALRADEFQAFLLSLKARPSRPDTGFQVERGDFTASVRGSGREAGGRRLSRNPRSRFNNLFQN